jgi:hypothetical protein
MADQHVGGLQRLGLVLGRRRSLVRRRRAPQGGACPARTTSCRSSRAERASLRVVPSHGSPRVAHELSNTGQQDEQQRNREHVHQKLHAPPDGGASGASSFCIADSLDAAVPSRTRRDREARRASGLQDVEARSGVSATGRSPRTWRGERTAEPAMRRPVTAGRRRAVDRSTLGGDRRTDAAETSRDRAPERGGGTALHREPEKRVGVPARRSRSAPPHSARASAHRRRWRRGATTDARQTTTPRRGRYQIARDGCKRRGLTAAVSPCSSRGRRENGNEAVGARARRARRHRLTAVGAPPRTSARGDGRRRASRARASTSSARRTSATRTSTRRTRSTP